MAKASKMNRGVSSKTQRGGGSEIKLPEGVHSLDAHGNIFASLPELSRVQPKYFSMDEIRSALTEGRLTTLSEEDISHLEGMINRK